MRTEEERKITELCSALDGLKCEYTKDLIMGNPCGKPAIARVSSVPILMCKECLAYWLDVVVENDRKYQRERLERDLDYLSKVEYL